MGLGPVPGLCVANPRPGREGRVYPASVHHAGGVAASGGARGSVARKLCPPKPSGMKGAAGGLPERTWL